MSETKRAEPTPGPWEVAGLTIIESSGQHRDICEMFSLHEHTVEISESEAEANARLIAASWELLQALEASDKYIAASCDEDTPRANAIHAKNQAAIARARGHE